LFLATRIFELAREIGVTSKDILEKCRAEGLDVKNHMATLSAGLEATIRDWFAEAATGTAIETTEHVDLEQARQKAKRQRRKGTKQEEDDAVAAAEATALDAANESPDEAVVAEQAPADQADSLAAEPVTEITAEQAQADNVDEAAPVTFPAEVPVELPPVVDAQPAEPPVAEVAQPVAPVPAAPAAPATPIAQVPVVPAAEPAKPAQPQVPPAKVPVRPAGPQLIPRPAKLQGPRVVRVEKPDFIHTPRRRPPMPRPGQAGPNSSAGPAGTVPPAVPLSTGISKKPKKPLTAEEEEEEAKAAKKRTPRRRGGRSAESGEGLKEWRNQDLVERAERLSAAGGGLRRHRPGSQGQSKSGEADVAKAKQIDIDEPISIKSLSAATGIKSGLFIRKLMELGVIATINKVIDATTAETLMMDFGMELNIKRQITGEGELASQLSKREQGELSLRAPVVTFLGHVDHGKTSLLDRIRSASVATKEAGGITQHIGSYRYDVGKNHVVFLDTPGHEAFTAMRARGANMTDVVVLVVAADDGVMPQTIEALSHARAAKVPIVVALNKIDVPNANVQRVLGQLAEHNLQPREWGGNVEVIQTSATTGQGVDTLVETLSLEAELLELKAETNAPAEGYVIESKMGAGMGVLARLLVRNGTLKVGDIVLAGCGYGRVRNMVDDRGKPIDSAGPSTPVEVSGFDEIPGSGDKFYVLKDLDTARSAAQERRQQARTKDLAAVPERTLESLLGKIEAGKATELPLIIKADVQGSIEAIVGSINKLSGGQEVRVNILYAAVGGITTGDVSLAEASNAIIIGFNAVPDAAARQLAEADGVDIRLYRIIYEILEDIRKALEEGLAPEERLETLGRAEIRQVFKVSRVGSIAGCFVTDGVASRSAKVRVTRNNIVIADERTLDSLKRFKDDAREVRAGMECGLKIAGYDDIREGDTLEFYHKVQVARKL
jgi:translation initiation factor IF-2